MELYSTNKKSPNVNLKTAIFQGLPEDNGLFIPTAIPSMSKSFFNNIQQLSFQDIAFEVSKTLLSGEVNESSLLEIIKDAFDFNTPVIKLSDQQHVLELWHGPTCAFKDYGARFMSRLMGNFLINDRKEITILVATSGDTGGAVGYGFLNVEGIQVKILYPKGKVSEIQEKQLTTIGNNVTAIEIDGNFDDCQFLVKSAFLDKQISNKLNLTSANSINIARLIPQSFYYFHAYAQLKHNGRPLVCSVPSGNFGNLSGGLLAYKMGLPVEKFIAATNVNDIVPNYLKTGVFKPKPSKETISNAMDVGNPSNFPRILAILDQDEKVVRNLIQGYAFDDKATRQAIKQVYGDYQYLMCPHTAVAYLGLKEFMHQHDNKNYCGLILSTAHPAKFRDVVSQVIQKDVPLPEGLTQAYNKNSQVMKLSNKFEALKSYLMG